MDNTPNQGEAISQFIEAMRAAGIDPPDHIDTGGVLKRFTTNGKSGDDAGWYVFHGDGIPAGAFGDWRSDIHVTWAANFGRKLSQEEARANRERMESAGRLAETEKARKAERAAKLAAALLEQATPAQVDHPYVTRKQITPANLSELSIDEVRAILGYSPQSKGEPLIGRVLVAPITVNGELSSCELIDETGNKSAIAGGVKAGGCWQPEPIPGQAGAVAIVEGIATALSVKAATSLPVVAALSSGNLVAIAKQIRSQYTAAEIILCADIAKVTGTADQQAVEAAKAIGGVLAIPDIYLTEGTDFNDQATARGLDAVRSSILAVISKPDVSTVSTVQASNGGASACNGIDSSGVSNVSEVENDSPETPPEASLIPCLEERPRFIVLDDWHREGARCWRPGVWLFGVKSAKGDATSTLTEQWICSPLHIEAVTHDQASNNIGRLLRFNTTLGTWREWAMPCDMLAGDGSELCGELLSMGVEFDPLSRNLFRQYLSRPAPKRRIHCALAVGWCGESFVLPDVVIGPKASSVIFQSGERGQDEYTTAGTLEGWQEAIGARAVGNPLLCLAISAAFAGPLLNRVNGESGGIHIVGDSSTGKSTAIEAACSVWGGAGFKRSWRATSNGMEGAASLFNDSLLALDEISECDPREVGAIVYSLCNGRGKQRATRTGRARAVSRWRCFVLSSGERTIATTMAEGGHRTKAGQAVRLLDVPAARTFGAWDELHGFATGQQLSDALKTSAAKHYGHVGRTYLERLTRESRNLAPAATQIPPSVATSKSPSS
jgi:putative DNA primase/helicase